MLRTKLSAAVAEPTAVAALAAGRGLVLDGMLGRRVAHGVREAALRLDAIGVFRAEGVGRRADTDAGVRGDRILWLEPPVRAELQPVLAMFESLMTILSEVTYAGVDAMDCQLAIYDEGPGYDAHRDAFADSAARRLTALYYANPWRPGDGGELELYDDDGDRRREVEPIADRLVVFRADATTHAVRPVLRGPRVALTAFMRNAAASATPWRR